MRYRKQLVILAQAAVSVGVLAWLASRVDLSDSMAVISAIPPRTVALATATVGVGFVVGAARWGVLLRNFSIALPFRQLVGYTLMGLFLSLLLPTSIGGDAFRVYAVARSTSKPAAVVFATVQDRMLGLCASIAVSLAAMPLAGGVLPPDLRVWMVVMQGAGVAGLVLVLYPPLVYSLWTWSTPLLSRLRSLGPRLRPSRIAGRLDALMARLGGLMRTRPANVPVALALGLLPVVVISFAYQVVLTSMGVDAKASLLMMVIPMVWIVRLLPISLGGIGVGEGAFVLLARMAGIDGETAFATAIAVLAMQIAWALVGGALLLRSGLKKAVDYANRP